MPALSTIVVNDGQTVPVSHTFTQGSPGGSGVGLLYESDGTVIGDNKLTLKPADRNAAKLRPSMIVAIPTTVTETVDGVDSTIVKRTAYARVDLTFMPDHTSEERALITGLVKNLLGDADVQDVLVDLQSCW